MIAIELAFDAEYCFEYAEEIKKRHRVFEIYWRAQGDSNTRPADS